MAAEDGQAARRTAWLPAPPPALPAPPRQLPAPAAPAWLPDVSSIPAEPAWLPTEEQQAAAGLAG